MNPPAKHYGRLAALVLLWGVGGCGALSSPSAQTDSPAQASESAQDKRVVLENATLEHAGKRGQTRWKLQVERVRYSHDRQRAQLEGLRGNLYRQGELVLQVEAQQGKLARERQTLTFQGEIAATDPRNAVTIRSDRLAWQAQQGILVAPNRLSARTPQAAVSAQQGRYKASQQQLTLTGGIEAQTQDPAVQLQTQQLRWSLAQQELTTDRRVRLERERAGAQPDGLVAGGATVALPATRVQLQERVTLQSVADSLQLATERALWRPQARTVTFERPVRAVDRSAGVTLEAARGELQLEAETVRLRGGVRARREDGQAKLYARQLSWDIPQKHLRAQGEVAYWQQDPQLATTGSTATGRLAQKQISVQGQSGKQRAVTQIAPQSPSSQ